MTKSAVKSAMRTVPCGWDNRGERPSTVTVHGSNSSNRRQRDSFRKVWYECQRDGCHHKFKSGTTRPKCTKCGYGSVKRLRMGEQ